MNKALRCPANFAQDWDQLLRHEILIIFLFYDRKAETIQTTEKEEVYRKCEGNNSG